MATLSNNVCFVFLLRDFERYGAWGRIYGASGWWAMHLGLVAPGSRPSSSHAQKDDPFPAHEKKQAGAAVRSEVHADLKASCCCCRFQGWTRSSREDPRPPFQIAMHRAICDSGQGRGGASTSDFLGVPTPAFRVKGLGIGSDLDCISNPQETLPHAPPLPQHRWYPRFFSAPTPPRGAMGSFNPIHPHRFSPVTSRTVAPTLLPGTTNDGSAGLGAAMGSGGPVGENADEEEDTP
ncbi:hypothetical protein BDK51DRAFT_47940 [Blyttiomyces helicus]|uniref:Uncharacterized protein n=1 Tax=Blyttiomyces helicus TaxID=388810 RepID=A0A4P9W990_9FUNG|nr:hypothetical protein BDK51DRAFT_47940 [Blyttiomyces helicus]|eukprot:RKO86766.1 hypothetical protein BDK51DRAFT_47940 [Blyttiomyces helicus]